MPGAGYSGTPLWRKLGYHDGLGALVLGAPNGYVQLLGLPENVRVSWLPRPRKGMAFVHLFARGSSALGGELVRLRERIVPSGVVWASWPKKTSGVATDITEDEVRRLALPLGFVDIKVCAVDETWSALKLVIRRSER